MLNPREEYAFLKGINNIKRVAYDTLYVKYIVENIKGESKKTEIESTDQEGLIASLNGGYPIPGMVYTFIYGEPDQVQLMFGHKEFIDVVPMVFCMGVSSGMFKGINMNMLPPDIRLSFLDLYYTTFKDFFAREAEELSQNNLLALNKRFIEVVKSGKGQDMVRAFSRKSGNNFNYGYRSYLLPKVKRLRMVEYNEWLYIPFYEPLDAFREMNQKEIHKYYYLSK